MSQTAVSNKPSGNRKFTPKSFLVLLIVIGVALLIVASEAGTIALDTPDLGSTPTSQNSTPTVPSQLQLPMPGFGIQFRDLILIVSVNTIFSGIISFIFQKLIEGEIQRRNSEKLEEHKTDLQNRQEKEMADFRKVQIEQIKQIEAEIQLRNSKSLEEYKIDLQNKQEKEMADFRKEQLERIKQYEVKLQVNSSKELEILRSELGLSVFKGQKLYEERLKVIPNLLTLTQKLKSCISELLYRSFGKSSTRPAFLYQQLSVAYTNFLDAYEKSRGLFELAEKIGTISGYVGWNIPVGIEEEEPNTEYVFEEIEKEGFSKGLSAVLEIETYLTTILQNK